MSCGPAPHTHLPQETVDQPPDLYCPPGAPFGPVHFTKYPPNLVYYEFTLEEILIHNPKTRTRETEVLYREGTKIIWSPLLFQDKYNFRPAYLVPMTPPLTPRLNRLQESVATNESTSTQIFGVMYITPTGLIDSMVPVSRPWAILGKLLSYIVKLAPIFWWALPTEPAGCLPASSQEPPSGWIPDKMAATISKPTDKNTMSAYIAQRLQSAALEPFARATNNNTTTWTQSAQSKLARMKCPQQFWIAEISIQLTHNTDTWCNKWHKEHTDKNWDTFKQDFLARFMLKDTVLMIICQVKSLTQTGTVKEFTRTYKELQLRASSDMAFDTPVTHLMYYNTLKLHVMRHMNLDQVTNIKSIYCKVEKAEKYPTLFTRRKLENKRDLKTLTQAGVPHSHPWKQWK
ncbi:hypothetical protein DSO57_1023472 [Entomophthora muscae]|uniref:Uncharacterized protein n=1 Tax=Entomophthora muscae TaxID=34485 RepID=A0ACC2TQE2_9FUNG|nr:hypothetical protein DSO57_1023472 [Entomophthora muscae]